MPGAEQQFSSTFFFKFFLLFLFFTNDRDLDGVAPAGNDFLNNFFFKFKNTPLVLQRDYLQRKKKFNSLSTEVQVRFNYDAPINRVELIQRRKCEMFHAQ